MSQADSAAEAPPTPARAELTRLSIILAMGWLVTNVGLQIGTLPLKFVLKDEVHLAPERVALFFAIGHASNYLKTLAGVLTDSVPLCGTRRRHYLLFSLIATGLGWMLLSFVPRSWNWMLGVYTVMYISVVFTSTTLGGVMVEVGNRFRAAGRLTAQRIGMFKAAELIGGPIAGILATLPFTVPATVGGALHLGLIPLLLRFLPKEPPARVNRDVWPEVARQARVVVKSRTLMGAAGMTFLLAAAPGLNTPLLFYQTDVLHFQKPFIGLLATFGAAAGMAASVFYFYACRRFDLRWIVSFSIVIHCLGALGYLFYKSPQTAIAVSLFSGMTTALATLPVYDISARATPKGSEAIGYALMMSVWNITNAMADVVGSRLFEVFGRNLTPLIWVDALSTLVALAAVPFMPAALTTREDQHVAEDATAAA